jgi:pyruvate,orthophosphate dikinase
VRTAVDFADEGAIDRETALSRIAPEQLDSVLAPLLTEATTADAEVLARGTPACPGVASGVVVDDSDAAEIADGDVVLARLTTSPEDVSGMIAARAVVTERGGATSHAAVVTRALGRPSVVGVGDHATSGWAGREVTVDGSKGVVYAGRLPTEDVPVEDIPGLEHLLAWARELSPAEVVDDAPDAVDLDLADIAVDPEAGIDVEALTERMRGASAVRGSMLNTPEGVRAVLRAGVPVIVRRADQHAATMLLRLVQAREG